MQNVLTGSDKRLLLICAAIAAASIWIGVNYFYKAFPEASVDFSVSQDRAKDIATRFLTDRGADVGAYRNAGIFGYDDSVKTFLEKDMGLEQANAIMGTKLRLWRWANRWYVPLQKEEYRVDVTTRGEVVRYSHLIPEEREGATLDRAAARAKAEAFLTTVMGWDLAKLDFVEDQTQQRPKRTDYTFTWKEHDWSFHDASHRVSVEIDGADVGGYKDFVHVPEQWMRSYRELRAQNQTASQVDLIFMMLLVVGMLVVIVQRIRRRDVRRRPALYFGGITAVLAFLASLNSFSLVEFNYVTTDSYASFLASGILGALVSAIFEGLAIAFFTAAAESLYREFMPRQLALPNFFRRRTIRTKTFFISIVVGLTLTCFFFAYQTIFYLVANQLGAWSPADVPFDNLMNTKLPWVFVLLGGFFPAVSEEFIFRMFAIPFLRRLLKWRWLAIVLAAFIWGFGHSAYPNEPFFIRGLEVGIGGVIMGLVMLRFGILTTLVWHYTVDALYTAILMLRSGNAYYVGSGAVSAGIMLIPLAICVIAYLRHKSFAPEDDLTNAHEGVAPPLPPAPAAVETATPTVGYSPLRTRSIVLGIIAAAALCATAFIPVTKIGEKLDVAVTRDQAETRATAFLRARGENPSSWSIVTNINSSVDKYADQYILQRRDIQTFNTVYGSTIHPVTWRTRFYRPLQKEEYSVYTNIDDGSVYTFTHELAEDAPGPTLEADSARAIATQYLARRGIGLTGFTLKESKAEDKKARRDYTFTWEADSGSTLNVDDARLRMEVRVGGGDVVQYRRYMKLPEEWIRGQDETTLLTSAHTGVKIVLVVALLLCAIWLFVKRLRQSAILWKSTLITTAILVAVIATEAANNLPTLFESFPTTQTVQQYVVILISVMVVGGVLISIGIILATGLSTSLYPSALESLRGASFRARARDAVAAAVMYCGAMYGAHHVHALVAQAFPGSLSAAELSPPGGIASFIPAWEEVIGAPVMAVIMTAAIGIVLYIALQLIRRRSIIIPSVIAIVLIAVIPDRGTPVNMMAHMISPVLDVLVFLAFMKWILRDNILAYIVAFVAWSCVEAGLEYVSLGAQYYLWNGVAMLVFPALVLAWLWIRGTSQIQSNG